MAFYWKLWLAFLAIAAPLAIARAQDSAPSEGKMLPPLEQVWCSDYGAGHARILRSSFFTVPAATEVQRRLQLAYLAHRYGKHLEDSGFYGRNNTNLPYAACEPRGPDFEKYNIARRSTVSDPPVGWNDLPKKLSRYIVCSGVKRRSLALVTRSIPIRTSLNDTDNIASDRRIVEQWQENMRALGITKVGWSTEYASCEISYSSILAERQASSAMSNALANAELTTLAEVDFAPDGMIRPPVAIAKPTAPPPLPTGPTPADLRAKAAKEAAARRQAAQAAAQEQERQRMAAEEAARAEQEKRNEADRAKFRATLQATLDRQAAERAAAEKFKRDQAEYERKRAEYERQTAKAQAERAEWERNYKACMSIDRAGCIEDGKPAVSGRKIVSTEAQKAKARGDEVLSWKEGVALCMPPAPGKGSNATCHGPLQVAYGTLGQPSGDQAITWACGGSNWTKLGQAGGYIAYGCGFGTHPEDPGGKYPGNIDTEKKLGVGFIPGRREYHCPRRTSAYCKTL